MAGGTEDSTDVSWSLFVDEAADLVARGAVVHAQQPEVLSRAFADAQRREPNGGQALGDALRDLLGRLGPIAGPMRLEIELEAPLWRLSAADPEAASEAGGTLPCTLRATLPPGYPAVPPTERHGGGFEVVATGSLGREASRAVSRAAHGHLAGLVADAASQQATAAGYLTALAFWVQESELHELAASTWQPVPERSRPVTPSGGDADGRVRAFVRFHHVQSRMKRGYMRMWAHDLGVSALLAGGQPAMVMAEGPRDGLRAFIDRSTKACHWGPTPARLVGSFPVNPAVGARMPVGLQAAAEAFPGTVAHQGTYNGRDCVDFAALAAALQSEGYEPASRELRSLSGTGGAFAHTAGRVEEALDGSGWVGYRTPEPPLCNAGYFAPPPRQLGPGADGQESPDGAGAPVPPQPNRPARRWGRTPSAT